MYYECSECQALLHGDGAPFVCPRCGLAGVAFCLVDETEVVERVSEGDEAPVDVGPPSTWGARPLSELR